MSRVVVAISPHEIPERPPIRLEIGDRVKVGERDSEWPDFVFVTAHNGAGWVPERHLDREGSSAVVTEAYDTAELPTEEGEELEVLHEDLSSGWIWCRARHGREGWVPAADTLIAGLISLTSASPGPGFMAARASPATRCART